MWYVLSILLFALSSAQDFKIIHKWRNIDIAFPNDAVREMYTAMGKYIPENNMPLGVDVWEDKIFMTVPRWRRGVVSNLNYIKRDDKTTSPVLIPYPNLETNDMYSHNGIVNIFRTRVDACNRLWAVDTGVEDIAGNLTVVKPVRILVFDLKKNEMMLTYTLKDTDQKPDTFIADLIVDVDPNMCEDAYAYLPDFGAYGLVVYSLAKGDSWRLSHNYFYFDPLEGDYNVDGFNFQWTDGIFGMALSPKKQDGYKTLYFHAMSGKTEFSVSTKVLKDKELALGQNYHHFRIEGKKGPLTQGPTSVIDPKTGIDYFTQVNRNGIACWDTNTKLNPDNFILVAQDNRTMIFPNDLSLDCKSRELYVLADNFPKFQFSEYDPHEYNFFMWVGNLDKLAPRCRKQN